MQLYHLSAALTAFDAVSFLTPPSLLLFQTLLTGVSQESSPSLPDGNSFGQAILMHIVGNTASCWSLTAYASRTLVALGYHNIHALASSCDREELEEIRVAVAWCYHFDRLMSLLLFRPMSLPHLEVEVSSLVKHVPGNPMSVFAKVMLDMVPIHEKILEMTLDNHSKGSRSPDAVYADVEQLRRRMAEIYAMVELVRMVELSGTSILIHISHAQQTSTLPTLIICCTGGA